MRGIRGFRWACLAALILLLGPSVGVAIAATGPPFVAPVEGKIIRPFEPPPNRFAAGHRGIDYGVPAGTPVKASGAGTVSFAGPVAGDGLFITIQHLNDIATTYSYLARVDVQRGDEVIQGQVIGLSGDGHGGSLAALHFGAKQKGEYIDPGILLRNYDDITDLISLEQIGRRATSGRAAFTNGPNLSRQAPDQNQPSVASGNLPSTSAELRISSLPAVGGPTAVTEPVIPIPPVLQPQRGADTSTKVSPLTPTAPTEAAWWRSIPGELKQRLLERDPAFLEKYEGVSARERDALNRELLDLRIEQLREERDALGAMAEFRHNTGLAAKALFFGPASVLSKFDRESAIDRKIRSAEALRDQLNEVASDPRRRLSKSDVYLLDFDIDFANGDGKAVVALGDPGTAEHIGVLVPGMNNAVGSIGRSLGDAAALRSEVHRAVKNDLDKRTSTIVWMGYDNPNGVQDAINRGEAIEGAPWLKTFVNDIRAGHVESPEAPHITVYGHSYGSTVAGIAALDGMKADDVVFLGSPGVGRWFVDSGDFPQERIWAARPWTDIISLVTGALGIDPTSEAFNAREVPLGSEQRGHSDYYALGTRGLQNLARILVGKIEKVK